MWKVRMWFLAISGIVLLATAAALLVPSAEARLTVGFLQGCKPDHKGRSKYGISIHYTLQGELGFVKEAARKDLGDSGWSERSYRQTQIHTRPNGDWVMVYPGKPGTPVMLGPPGRVSVMVFHRDRPRTFLSHLCEMLGLGG
jgi:hypothetical protein